MTESISISEIASRLKDRFTTGIVGVDQNSIEVKGEFLLDIASFLKTTPGLDFDYLVYITAVDYQKYFELIYQLMSLKHNHRLMLKTRCYSRDFPSVPSVVSLWRGADFQEREVFDLMGISFHGHPNMKRIFLWEGFEGYPLRKDFNNGT
jgi:NADH-quinone oxidoreductase subunit C